MIYRTYSQRIAVHVPQCNNNMDNTQKEPIKLKSFPVYLPEEKYRLFNSLCKTKRMPMTKIAEAEIDKFIKREQSA